MFNEVLRRRKSHLQPQLLVFSISCSPLQKIKLVQKQFLEDLVLYIVKGYCQLSYTKNILLEHLVFCQYGHVVCLRWQLSNEVILNMFNKIVEHHILHSFAKTTTINVTFDLWMSCGGFDTWRYYTNKK